ncbi:MAG: BatD family protein [Desulfobacterales bacterium]|nr:BatD family protein [Desulfobacterales bacterium]
MKRLFTSILLFLFIGMPGAARAQVSVDLKLDRSEATTADSVRLVVSVSGVRNAQSPPVLKGLENFRVTPGGTASRMEIVNGKVSAGVDFTFYLQPQKTGSFQIGPAEITIEGQRYQSRLATLSVVTAAGSAGAARGELFLTAELSAHEVYPEEQTVYTVKLYRRVKVRDISISLPENDHLVFKQLAKAREYETVHNGQRYQVLEVRYAVVSHVAGTHVLDPSRMTMTVLEANRRRQGGIFDNPLFDDSFFSFSGGRPATVASEPIKLKVADLPDAGKPADFSGLVGQFTIKSDLQPLSVKAGESATLTVQVAGQGNVQRIPDIKLPDLEHARIYADQPVLEVSQDIGGLKGVKTMKWALVPERAGDLVLPPLTLSYFDPEARRYRTEKAIPPSLKVLPGRSAAARSTPVQTGTKDPDSAPPVKEEVKELGRDILPVHTSARDLMAPGRLMPEVWVSCLLVLAPLCFYLMVFYAVRTREKTEQSRATLAARRALKNFMKNCHGGHLGADGLIDAIRIYLNDRCTLSLGALTWEEVCRILKTRGVRPETIETLRPAFQALEMAVYGGRGNEPAPDEASLIQLIRQVDRELK